MRITRRQLTQIIREELLQEARMKNPDVVELQIALGLDDAEVDGVWGPTTEQQWDKFVEKHYTPPRPGDTNPSLEEVQDDWASAGPKMKFTGDAAGAVKFINTLNDFARVTPAAPVETTLATTKTEPAPAGFASFTSGVTLPEIVVASATPNWFIQFYNPKTKQWRQEEWSYAEIVEHALKFLDFMKKPGAALAVESNPSGPDYHPFIIEDTASLRRFLQMDPESTSAAIPQQESVSRWSRLAGLLVD